MKHEQLWAPWRLGYIRGEDAVEEPPRAEPVWLPAADAGCFLCRDAASPADDRRNLVAWRGDRSLVVLNRYPYNNGHVLVAPARHLGRLDELDAETHAELMQIMTRVVGILERGMNADGFNVGLNLGRVAGAGLPGHLHWHIVPRWNGDVNFMPVLAGVKVIPQSLDALWEFLSDALRSAAS